MLTKNLIEKIEAGALYPDRSLTVAMINLDILRENLAKEADGPLLARFLLAEEISQFQAYTYPKRQIEWLGGRLAAKEAAGRLAGAGPPAFLDWQVHTDANGRPLISRAYQVGNRLPDISISHSRNLAGALAVDKGRCGLDIQQITGTVIKVGRKFIRPDEAAVLDNAAGPLTSLAAEARLTLLWAAKEAIRKASATSPLPGFLELRLRQIAPIENQTPEMQYIFKLTTAENNAVKDCRVAAGLKGDFALAITVVDEYHNDRL